MAGAPGARPRSIVNTLHHEHVHHSRRTGGPGPAPDRRISPSCASPSRCSQPECWPRPSSGRRAARRRPRRPRPPPPTRRPAARLRRPPARPRPALTAADPIASWGVDGTAVAVGDHRQRRLRRRHLHQRRLPDRRDACARQPGGVLPGRRQRCSTRFTRQLRRRPVNALTTDGTSLFVGGNFTTLNGAAVEPPGEAQRPDRCPSTPASPRARSRSTAAATPTDGVLALAYSDTACSTPVVTSARSATGAGMGQSTGRERGRLQRANRRVTGWSAGARQEGRVDRRQPG